MTAPSAAVADHSLMDPRTQSSPYAFYELLHRECPVYRMPETGIYIVTRYEDVRRVLLDPETFSNTFGESFFELQGKEGAELYRSILRAKGWDHAVTLQRADPPEHPRHRRWVEFAFSPKRVRAMAPMIDAIVAGLIDAFEPRGECEFMRDFALPLPAAVVADIVGIPKDELSRFKQWSDALLAPVMHIMTREDIVANANLEIELQHHLARMFEERRANPGDDLISALATARDEHGEPVPMDVYQNIMHQFVSGGFETLTGGISHAMWLLVRYPEQQAKLRARPELLANFIDEALRIESPTQGLLRRTTRDVEVAGTLIPKGSMVAARFGAANHDGAKFVCPHAFDIERINANAHLAFGAGVHFCVGRQLARQELRIAFAALLSRLEEFELARPLPDPPHVPSILLHSLKELPIRFRARIAGAEQRTHA